jgi:hypothetical protein
MKNATEIARQNRLGELHAAAVAATRYEAPSEEDAHNWVKGVLDIDHADGTTWHGIPTWTRRAEQEAWERARFPALFSQVASGQPLPWDGDETMSKRKDDEVWNAADYDDEPRSNGNFGLDVQQQEAQAKALVVAGMREKSKTKA